MSAVPKARPVIDETLAAIVDSIFIKANGEPVADHMADETLARVMGQILRSRLAARRSRGLSGWHVKGTTDNRQLLQQLQRHVADGSMVDVMRLAAIIYVRAHLYGMEA